MKPALMSYRLLGLTPVSKQMKIKMTAATSLVPITLQKVMFPVTTFLSHFQDGEITMRQGANT